MSADASAVAGVLLTGGQSRRMGRDKATIVFDGETLAARAARVLAAVCEPVIEVGSGVSGLSAIREDPPGQGPLRAFVAGVEALSTEALGMDGPVVLLACDLPYVDEQLVRLVARWPGVGSVVPVVAGRPQFSCSRWSRAAIEAGARGGTALRSMVGPDTAYLDERVWGAVTTVAALTDVDTPDDLTNSLDLS